jgi:hypothetical protein
LTPLLALLGLCLLIVTVCYTALCASSPWGTCTRCRHRGDNHACRACDGTGMRPRLGWQLYAYARHIYRDGTR